MMVTLTCSYCKKDFQRRNGNPSSNNFCSNDCKWSSQKSKDTKSCKRCGKEFRRPPSRKSLLVSDYCSQSCRSIDVVHSEKECTHCKQTFLAKAYKTGSFCSRKCANYHRLGYPYGYIPRGEKQRSVKLRKHYREVAEEKIGRVLESHEHVHHIDGDIYNNLPDNIEVISNSEHGSMHYLERVEQRK